MEPYALRPGEGATYRYGIGFTVKSGEMHPGRGAAFTEYVTRKGEEPPDHTHPTEGEIELRCAGRTFPVAACGFVYLPQGIQHGYTILTDGDVRLIAVTFPVIKAS